MKKMINLLLLVIFSFLTFNITILAETTKAKLTYDGVNLRSGPGTNYMAISQLYTGETYDLLDTNKVKDERGCSSGWYKISYSGSAAYVCSDYIAILTYSDPTGDASTDCEINLKAKGFPASYWPYLCGLKKVHPNWNFEANVNGLDFATAVSKEAVGSKSLINVNYQGYFSTAVDSYNYLTDTFIVKEGSNWYSANSDVVAYYMDPRNFLDETSIFMFEKLSYDGGYQTQSAVESVLAGRDIRIEAPTIILAAQTYNINAIYLASRIRQETGGNYSNYSLSGRSATVNGVYYPHIYNPYNIGANTGAEDGIVWAAKGTSYLRPWTNIQTAIKGGAYFIADSYISQGQDTGYFQKFNTASYSKYSMYSHQYMTNVRAAASEASISYNGYSDMNLLNTTNFTFVIPVYSNMNNNNYNLPNKGNPNNHLKAITIGGTSLPNFAHDNYNYTYYVPAGTSSVNINGSVINSKAKISGVGNVSLPGNETNITLKVTAENGAVQNYVVKVVKTDGMTLSASDVVSQSSLVKSDNYLLFGIGSSIQSLNDQIKKVSSSATVTVSGKSNGNLVTGDTIVVKNGSSSVSMQAVVKGDPTGDGNINIQDLLRIQKFVLGYADLSGSYLKACDTNNDGLCNITDLLRTQKHILGYITIN